LQKRCEIDPLSGTSCTSVRRYHMSLPRVELDMCGRPPWRKKNLSKNTERGRVLTCVRPFAAAVTCRWPVWEFAERVQFNLACSRRLSMIWFSRSRLVDRCAILFG
jgi:hypothetical protein